MESAICNRPRARDIGIVIGTLPTGRLNSITDVPGVKVGHVSLIEGQGCLQPGKGPIRTGVTAILPHGGDLFTEKVCAAAYIINGFGKSVGLPQIMELGNIETPILLTNTLNAWIVADALVDYMLDENPNIRSINPVVGECNDSRLNDIAGRHVKKEHVFAAIKGAGEVVEEGCVGAGVGMQCFGWKGGIGTSSRIVKYESGEYTLGVLVLTNMGRAAALRIDGVPVGKELVPEHTRMDHGEEKGAYGSIMIIVGTNAPLTSRQLGRVAKRAAFGLARTGAEADHGSGDFVIAFSNGTLISASGVQSSSGAFIPETELDLLFRASIDATEESILNALFKAETTVGRDGQILPAIPIDSVLEIIRAK